MSSADVPEDASAPAARADGSRWRARPEIVVGLLVLLLVAPFVQALTAQPAPRVALTGALVDDGSLRIDGYLLGVDFATHDGHTYSDKAPAQSFLAAPAYAGARVLGMEPARVPRVDENLTLWWVTMVSAVLPLLVLVAAIARAVRRRGLEPTVAVLGALVFGTMLLPFSSNLYGHVLAAAFAFGAWVVLDGSDRRRGRAWIAGLLVGVAVTAEYQVAIVALVLVGFLLLRRRWGQLGRFVLGALPLAVALMAHQLVTTGSPLDSSYSSKQIDGESGLFVTHLRVPTPASMVEILVGSRGLLLFTPVVAIGLVGLVQRWRSERDDGAAVALAVWAGFFLLQAAWINPWGGEMPGPRYLIPALPFLAIGLADVWGRVPVALRRVAVAVSVTSMGLATVAGHLTPDGALLIDYHLRQLWNEGPVPTVFTMALGPVGWLVQLVLVAAVVVALRRPSAGPTTSSVPATAPEHEIRA